MRACFRSTPLRAPWRHYSTTQLLHRDRQEGFHIDPKAFERFNQVDDVFCRSFWDSRIRSKKTESFFSSYRKPLVAQWTKRGDGFTQKDYALRNASWHAVEIFADNVRTAEEQFGRRLGFLDSLSTLLVSGPSEKADVGSPEVAAAEIKQVAKLFGASLVGITDKDDRFTYTHKFNPKTMDPEPNEQIPDSATNVIVIAQTMDHDLIRSVPSALSGTTTGLGYGHDAMVVLSLSQYIKNLGYEAVPCMNDTTLAIPYGVKAGLGEYGRLGLLITPEFGPRVRLGRVFTDMPLAHDQPKPFGVKEFCNVCNACAKGCPAKAVPHGPPSADTYNQSNIKGVTKWSVDGEKCFKYWAALNTDCAVCIRVCPYNRGAAWYDRLWVKAAGTPLRRFMLWLHQRLNLGKKAKPRLWWQRAVKQ